MHRFFIILLLLVAETAAAQVAVKALLDSTGMYVGDRMRLRLEVSKPGEARLLPLDLAQEGKAVLEFLPQQVTWDTLKAGDPIRLRAELYFTAWDSGHHQLPALPIVYEIAGRMDTVFAQGNLTIDVRMPAVDTVLADIKPIIAEPANLEDFLPYLAAIAALALLIALVVLFRRKQKQRGNLPPPPAIVLLPHEIALQKLAALRNERLWQKGQVKNYHSELTFIVREYLENRFQIKALEHTTGEIMSQLRQSDFDPALSEKLESLLQTADLVKFAKAQPPADFHERAMLYVEEFILETKPVVIPAAITEPKNAQ